MILSQKLWFLEIRLQEDNGCNMYFMREREFWILCFVLDLALVLHMEHGGGNNSTFTTRVVTSAGSDTYSVIAAALSSLKGPKHGGANIKVVEMMQDLKEHVKDVTDEDEVREYLRKLVRREAFDKRGLI